MRQKPGTPQPSADRVVRDIRHKTPKRHSTEEKIRIVLIGVRGEDSIAELCRCEGIAQSPIASESMNSSGALARDRAADPGILVVTAAEETTAVAARNARGEIFFGMRPSKRRRPASQGACFSRGIFSFA